MTGAHSPSWSVWLCSVYWSVFAGAHGVQCACDGLSHGVGRRVGSLRWNRQQPSGCRRHAVGGALLVKSSERRPSFAIRRTAHFCRLEIQSEGDLDSINFVMQPIGDSVSLQRTSDKT